MTEFTVKELKALTEIKWAYNPYKYASHAKAIIKAKKFKKWNQLSENVWEKEGKPDPDGVIR